MSTKRYPGESNDEFPTPFITMPTQPKICKPGQLPVEKVQQFFEEGYLVVESFFTPEELQPCRDAIDNMVDGVANLLFENGKIKDKFADLGLFKRLTKLEEECPGAAILLFKNQKMPKAFLDIWSNDRLLNLLEQILGPDIMGYPIWNLRTKTPRTEAFNIPWHQDSAYFSNESYDHMIASAWIPFIDATPENGCMQMLRKGHRMGKVARHTCCVGPTWYVDLSPEEMTKTLGADMNTDVVTLPVPYGGFLLFSNMIPHRSLPNVSDDIRWSVDLRWQSPYENIGFYGIGEGALMRSSKDPNLNISFDKFYSVDRKEIWKQRYYKQRFDDDPLDTHMTGPWMGQWEHVNHNMHVDNFKTASY